ncbi:DUF6522 family protein [Sinorhizobium sp. BG8]|uniref:DUF6522 family protein n=1 Tax=Sinorhizobium sp. BG8 TaxID=2613773 RepID=UPI00193CB22F|nr:DUF6522 family protein [Sinorhizobium sp. BG8]QRM57162.1 hypothetical protein F3Y30_21765 [Sinorhizobium sp. BG8]
MARIVEEAKLPPADGADRQFFLDSAFVAKAFDMSEARVRALMRRKLFRSTVEKGVGEDEGSWRLTLRCGNRAWQGILTTDGDIQRQSIGLVSAQRGCKD